MIPNTIVARFSDAQKAEAAKTTIEGMMSSAEDEVEVMFEKQDGMAESDDIAKIYTKYGFRNHCGWKHERPIITIGEEIIWEMPEGMFGEDATVLLIALGAQVLATESDDEDEQWQQAPYPLPYVPLEEDDPDFSEAEEEESPWPAFSNKKILH